MVCGPNHDHHSHMRSQKGVYLGHEEDVGVQQLLRAVALGHVLQVRDPRQQRADGGVPGVGVAPRRPQLRRVVQLLLEAAHVRQPATRVC